MAVRFARAEDVPAMLAIYTPYVLETTVSYEYTPPTPEEFYHRWERYTRQLPWLVWEENGEVLGYAYAAEPYSRSGYKWCAESSVYLRRDARGRGIGRKLYAPLEELLTLQGYRVLYAVITSENPESVAFHKALGFAFRAEFPGIGMKFGRELGTIWLEKWLNPGKLPIDFPVSWRAIVKNDGKFAALL